MAAFALTDTKILVGGLDQSCFSDNIGLERTGDTIDVTTFCSGGWREFAPGLSSWSASFGGPQDLAATAASATHTPDEYYQLNVGTAYPITFVPNGDAEGAVAYGSQALLQQYTPLTGSVGDAAKHNIMATPYLNTPLVRGVLATKQTVTATGVGTGHNLGAVSASQRVYCAVHLLTRGGTGSFTGELYSDDNSGFTSATSRGVVINGATSRTSAFISTAGAITDTWWRLIWAVSGGSPSFEVRVFIGIG